ncbi:SMP-30/gluconolactonase/LRE family protein [Sphingomonas immobilis]|uniref:SMP-30/gluconolactonase/LRE family protein n=1 Tax=Sphingomonas immobilis TaxID=3063997 RepID=A0ABT8ZXM5_9SPHN|nr:SMP-30/gluconolactonase/LRE family protein [Sphingomonas sp. CA1-15]MDO7842326.1 SMP-30/gluconolactonase/LRE family protein [Sphingomonas sp. CA1-15]
MTVEIIAEGLAFPEGPVVMADGSLIVVELGGGRVTRCWKGRKETISEIGGGPNGAAIGPDGALYVCNSGGLDMAAGGNATGPGCEGRLERIDLATGRVERVFDAAEGIPLSAPNDLIFAPDGSLWFTDMGKRYGRTTEASALLHCDPSLATITRVSDKAVSYNGVGLSPDGKTVYVADTFQARVYSFDAAASGRQKPGFVGTVPGMVWLDSLAVTAAGNVCVGTIFDGGISTVTPAGSVTQTPFDETFVTNIAFGGADMRDAYVTLSTTGLLVRARWSEPGLKLTFNA